MVALRSQFDGKQIITPEELRNQAPCDVIIVVLDRADRSAGWQAVQGGTLHDAWDNDEDSVYDTL